ncbi:DUF2239 family protein [Pigmentiphaga sp.]|uniref:DUF2239 family protein n=1 Tax=Pigmentiphaga sp. TaxID=1977564 RepID=UPI00128DFD8D|nr:DUF2239 family protein [Pigmentiphaga sp.]MPS26500.1 DUF2239 family protein [Alcaligenaceae bacterium SAGV5]MPS53591.1 DUF2239 family protein [Alcaligenaceae bacterium SAGV3]MPT57373.1 DUF2239 family protein [Alcaligenaceae bacterium]
MPALTCTAFNGHGLLASGPLRDVALAVHRAPRGAPVLIFDDATGKSFDIDTRGSEHDVLARLGPMPCAAPEAAATAEETAAPRGKGRPRLGVVAREVTLLPRHWDWLNAQPGGASVALRKLVEEARRAHADQDGQRRAREAAYHFMSAMAGDLPGFEEAARALFAGDGERYAALLGGWPADVRDYALRLAAGATPR